MNARLGIVLTTILLVMVAVIGQVRSERRAERRTRTVKADGLYAALQEPVPPVVLHHAVFGRPVQLAQAQSRVQSLGVNGRGVTIQVSVSLEYASSGIVIGQDFRAVRVNVGDPVSIGDFIIGGVVENTGSSPVRLDYAGGGGVELDAGERLYVGTEARILQPPGAEGGVAASVDEPELVFQADAEGRVVLADGDDPKLRPPTHCPLCSCLCQGNGCSCAITVKPDVNNCGGLDDQHCRCGTDPECTGRTSGCTFVFEPCGAGGDPQ